MNDDYVNCRCSLDGQKTELQRMEEKDPEFTKELNNLMSILEKGDFSKGRWKISFEGQLLWVRHEES